MQETQEILVRSLGREDHLEKEMATHSSILAWEIPWTEEPGGHKGVDTTERLSHHHHQHCFGCRTMMMKDSECSVATGGTNT